MIGGLISEAMISTIQYYRYLVVFRRSSEWIDFTHILRQFQGNKGS